MFERAVFQRGHTWASHEMDLGYFAESLLFYGRVDLALDQRNLVGLIKKIGPNSLLRLLSMPCVHAFYMPHEFATGTTSTPFEQHNFTMFSSAGRKRAATPLTKDLWLEQTLARFIESPKQTKRISRELNQKVYDRSKILTRADINILNSALRFTG